MFVHERAEIVIGRLPLSCDILKDEFHLLPQLPPNNGVSAIQAEGQGLTVVDLIPDKFVDLAFQFLSRRRPHPCPPEVRGQLVDITLSDDDL